MEKSVDKKARKHLLKEVKRLSRSPKQPRYLVTLIRYDVDDKTALDVEREDFSFKVDAIRRIHFFLYTTDHGVGLLQNWSPRRNKDLFITAYRYDPAFHGVVIDANYCDGIGVGGRNE